MVSAMGVTVLRPAGLADGSPRSRVTAPSGRAPACRQHLVDRGSVLRTSAAVDPRHEAIGVDQDVSTQLQRVVLRGARAPAAGKQRGVCPPHARVKPHASHARAPEPEGSVRSAVLVAEQQDVVKALFLAVEPQQRRSGERHDGDPGTELLAMVQHLHEVLTTGQSGQMAQEDQQRETVHDLPERYPLTVGVQHGNVGQPVAEMHHAPRTLSFEQTVQDLKRMLRMSGDIPLCRRAVRRDVRGTTSAAQNAASSRRSAR